MLRQLADREADKARCLVITVGCCQAPDSFIQDTCMPTSRDACACADNRVQADLLPRGVTVHRRFELFACEQVEEG